MLKGGVLESLEMLVRDVLCQTNLFSKLLQFTKSDQDFEFDQAIHANLGYSSSFPFTVLSIWLLLKKKLGLISIITTFTIIHITEEGRMPLVHIFPFSFHWRTPQRLLPKSQKGT